MSCFGLREYPPQNIRASFSGDELTITTGRFVWKGTAREFWLECKVVQDEVVAAQERQVEMAKLLSLQGVDPRGAA